jgi:hypothetical protein
MIFISSSPFALLIINVKILYHQFFMYHVYFDNVSHITLKWYKYNIFYIMFIYSWIYHPMNLKSFHCIVKVLLHLQSTCLIGAKNNHKIWTCFLLFKPSPNAFKFCMSFNTQEEGHVSNHSKIILHAFIETFLHDWLKWFQMCLMTKIVHNLSSWLKEKLYIWF